jgi:hypothetical protein
MKITVKAGGAHDSLSLTEVIPPIVVPADTKYIRHIRIQSAALTKFWGQADVYQRDRTCARGLRRAPQVRASR